MTREEALAILGLNPNYAYTELKDTELKKAYHAKAKQYHTDNHAGHSETEIEEMKKEFQKINDAKARLENKGAQDTEEVEMTKISYIIRLQNYANTCDDRELRSLIKQYISLLESVSSLKQLEDTYQDFCAKKKQIFQRRFQVYCTVNKIPPSCGHSLEYDTDYKDFIDQLEVMKYKYQKYLKAAFPDDMNRIVAKYSNYAGFQNVQNAIMIRKKEIETEVLSNFGECALYITEITTVFETFIIKTIQEYHQNLVNFQELATRITESSSLSTEEKTKKIERLRAVIETGSNEGFIRAYKDTMAMLDSIEQAKEIEDIYQSIKELADTKLQELHLLHDADKVTDIYQTVIEVCMLLKTAYPLRIAQSSLAKLKSIRLHKYENDEKIIQEVTRAINKTKLSTIYVGNISLNELPFYCFDYAHGISDYVGFNTAKGCPANHLIQTDKEKNWIPLLDFLNTHTLIGKPAINRYDSSSVAVLYSFDESEYLCYDNDKKKFVWIPKAKVQFIKGLRAILEQQNIDTKFLDRNILEKMILKQAQQIRMHQKVDEEMEYHNFRNKK